MLILFCSIGVTSIVFAGGRYASLGKEKVSKTECSFSKKSVDFTPVFITPEPVVIPDNAIGYTETLAPKTVRLYDLVSDPYYAKSYRCSFNE